jgi:hypothetical protein
METIQTREQNQAQPQQDKPSELKIPEQLRSRIAQEQYLQQDKKELDVNNSAPTTTTKPGEDPLSEKLYD